MEIGTEVLQYYIFLQIPVTALNGVFLITFFELLIYERNFRGNPFNERKTGLFILFWLADLSSDHR